MKKCEVSQCEAVSRVVLFEAVSRVAQFEVVSRVAQFEAVSRVAQFEAVSFIVHVRGLLSDCSDFVEELIKIIT